MGSTLHGYWGATKTVPIGSIDAAESNTTVFTFGQPVDIKRLIFVTTEAQTVATAKITVGVRDLDGSPTESHSAYTLPFSGSLIGDVQVMELAEPDTAAVVAVDGLDTHAATPTTLLVASNRELFILTDAGGNAGIYDIYAVVQELGFHVGAGDTGTSETLTRVAV